MTDRRTPSVQLHPVIRDVFEEYSTEERLAKAVKSPEATKAHVNEMMDEIKKRRAVFDTKNVKWGPSQ